jgi:hypothetical protein
METTQQFGPEGRGLARRKVVYWVTDRSLVLVNHNQQETRRQENECQINPAEPVCYSKLCFYWFRNYLW